MKKKKDDEPLVIDDSRPDDEVREDMATIFRALLKGDPKDDSMIPKEDVNKPLKLVVRRKNRRTK